MMEKVYIKLAWFVPKQIVYWCSIRLIAHATAGIYSNQVVSELLAMEALQRWINDNAIS